ncbi:NAD-dependent epimerase/dehydratase family protein [Bacillus methanolicus]|uniref:Putative UDP-glucose epimerase YtcB n=1 Tax=Bacillus methanolicus (strain MGA3 / ATCC 53907) TaxID=796606 RepID=I3E7X1_BACMM|nr:NAD-dependent epimerase/dehydratase family protein [Bacillus methanolicus]AIE59408.1 putative UDP-glucose epimerase YtcB [Bacillus methanolicus MGA3]EIJ82592.1 NAD-dependent epimerase/dehydratase [Bacillus methanolicus MGA3]
MKVLVTGAAGFIGSHLCEELLRNKDVEKVVGIDFFIGPTPPKMKKDFLLHVSENPKFEFIRDNLLTMPLENIISRVDAVYHLAAIPGVRSSWGDDFKHYIDYNILATQRLLEACKNLNIKKFIYASTSSIYGEKYGAVSEDQLPEPLSPYGITKLAGEHLCRVYEKYFGLPVVILRFFTVYGPRQRPDMAFHRFIRQLLKNEPVTIFGDGKQSRDFTFISDCARATASVLNSDKAVGQTINIGGKERASVLEVLDVLEEITDLKAKRIFLEQPAGEPKHTWASISKAKKLLDYNPVTGLKEGLKQECLYLIKFYRDDAK